MYNWFIKHSTHNFMYTLYTGKVDFQYCISQPSYINVGGKTFSGVLDKINSPQIYLKLQYTVFTVHVYLIFSLKRTAIPYKVETKNAYRVFKKRILINSATLFWGFCIILKRIFDHWRLRSLHVSLNLKTSFEMFLKNSLN